ncbi:CDP-glycerol glycerophosphotransferase family protein [Fictibacillus terranigra]|uniref:CDP-glycerol glycerophosphotransferase family protein n=1 Tax=Fictibacillus terranigra TaxID=3058424 RepID=A0ABT8E1H3_9BACL|nr:CDP-glycerol glycerophosphotransferase family protein [Fictibacillus sp. CENA-BCM004]MDN4071764.1 CDP-glycerol glycerophosphotransferase family protein [Fictibacillus sp. CENA-BCM004]
MLEKIKLLFKSIPAIMLSRFKQVDNQKIIFSSSNNTDFDYNSKYLFEYFINHKNNYDCKFVINDEEKRQRLNKEIGNYFIETKSFKGMMDVLQSGCWITSAGLPMYFPFIGKRRKIINLWHGVPLKKVCLLENNKPLINKLFFKLIFSMNYTSVVTTSRQLIPLMAKSMGVKEKRVLVLGQPRNDLIMIPKSKEILNSYFSSLPSFTNVILYAPTWRDKGSTKYFPFEDFDANKINDFLETKQLLLLIRGHKASSSNFFKETSRIKFLNNDKVEDIMEILNIFDLLITDYSGMYIDYLLLKRPILFLPYDLEEYSTLRGFNFDYEMFAPGPKPLNQKDFLIELESLIENENYYRDEREKVNMYFNEVVEGNCKRNFQYINTLLN